MSDDGTLLSVRIEARALEEARAQERRRRERLTAAILEARAAGHTLAEIGEVLGLTRQRVMQLSTNTTERTT